MITFSHSNSGKTEVCMPFVADPESDHLVLPVVSDMQYSGLSSTPKVEILKHKDFVNFPFPN